MEKPTQIFVCEQCHRTWERKPSKGRRPRYCPDCASDRLTASKRRSRDRHPVVRMPRFVTCQRPGCDNPMPPGSRADRKWCSAACQTWVSRRVCGQVSTTPRICTSCMQPLVGRQAGSATVCRSRLCRAWNQRHPGEPHPSTKPRVCGWCNTPIDHRDGRSKFCSKSCGDAHWNANNRGRTRELTNLRYATNPAAREYQRKYAQEHAEDRRRWARENRTRNPERYRAYYTSWVAANKDAYRTANKNKQNKRRAQKYGNGLGVGVSLRDWQRLVRRHRGRCAYCGGPTDPEPAQDHIIPLVLGGLHSLGNVLPVCTYCNSTKHKMLLAVWKYRCGGGKPAPGGWTKKPSVTRGERNGNTPLTENDVREIRRAHREGAKQGALAEQYKVSQAAISGILRWKTWCHVDPEDRPAVKPGRLTDKQVRQIRRLHDTGVSQKALAERFGSNQATVSLIVRRKSYEHVM